jgi:hypothetical protein
MLDLVGAAERDTASPITNEHVNKLHALANKWMSIEPSVNAFAMASTASSRLSASTVASLLKQELVQKIVAHLKNPIDLDAYNTMSKIMERTEGVSLAEEAGAIDADWTASPRTNRQSSRAWSRKAFSQWPTSVAALVCIFVAALATGS